jgi:hypothetical protein
MPRKKASGIRSMKVSSSAAPRKTRDTASTKRGSATRKRTDSTGPRDIGPETGWGEKW